MATRDWTTALREAILDRNAMTIAGLLRQGADPNTVVEPDGRSALAIAVETGDQDIVRLLVESAGAEVNRTFSHRRISPLAHAASLNQTEIVVLLLKLGADPRAVNVSGASPLHAGAGFVGSVRALLDAGAEIDARDGYGCTPLMAASGWSPDREGYREGEAVRYLITKGADVHASANEGLTALGAAALAGNGPAIRILLEGGADVNAPAYQGFTPLAIVRQQQDRLMRASAPVVETVPTEMLMLRARLVSAEHILSLASGNQR